MSRRCAWHARHTAESGDGADKYIDELITWRELSHTFCFYNRDRDLESVEVLADWARESLKQHESDERPALYDWETLARGATDDEFWNLLQHSLLTHGELHNNVRMTWGKAFLKWAPDAQTALDMAFDLNHRYALDGRDPNSYQGILWCFGHFDRPFDEKPIIGKVRPRDTEMARRSCRWQHVPRPSSSDRPSSIHPVSPSSEPA